MIVATAGHVDHGKTSLVRALTGIDTDRLPEEKKRGMTIDLGFAYLPLASGGTLGFVDVPGHERFVHNMLAGVSGIDFALLVVAADDGPMPQTREHLAILDLLGVARGAVALTKIDRVPAERLEAARAEIHALTRGSALDGASLFAVSSVSGEGLGELKGHLESVSRSIESRRGAGNFRLSVDRCFTIAGAGLVVTGTALSGEIAVGDEVHTLLAGMKARVRSIHAQNAAAERGRAGERLALNLAGLEAKTAIGRGDWIVRGTLPPPVARIDARLRVVAEQPLRHWAPVHVHLGAADVLGRVAVLEGKDIAPGASARVQLVLDKPIGAVFGDGFIVRDQSAQRTLGGGRVIDVFPPLRGRAKPERLAYLAAMEREDDRAALSSLLDVCQNGLDLGHFSANRNLPLATVEGLAPMQRAGRYAFSPQRWETLKRHALDTVKAWHERSPDMAGAPEERIIEGLRLPREVVQALAEALVAEGLLVREPLGLRLPAHRAQLSPGDEALWKKLEPALAESPLRPPTLAELAAAQRLDPRKLEAALARIARQGLLVRVSKTRFFLPTAVLELEKLLKIEARRGPITAAAFRDRSGIGRNVSIEVLEYFDRIKLTRRIGDTHVLTSGIRGQSPNS